jgi:GntR family transcriptional regulator/MocR family aminotransferase
MGKQSIIFNLAAISLEPSSDIPLHRQLYDTVRRAILEHKLKAGDRMPSTRSLALFLEVSRTTVVSSFDQLRAEGYIEGRKGSGTFVAAALPDDLLRVRSKITGTPRWSAKARAVSRRATQWVSAASSFNEDDGIRRAFQPGLPAIEDFPFDIWSKMIAKRWRNPTANFASYGDAAGYRPLREVISNYVQLARGVRCEPDQVIIVAGSQQGLDVSARILLDPGDPAWIEDPCYRGAQGALLGAGARIVPVPVDDNGIDVSAGESACREARVAYVTPSHQYPLGVTMSLARRLELLDWAKRCGGWILEDDYDSEYQYTGRPLSALQGLDKEDRVIYLGTLSKVLFPSLRLGYLIVPGDLVDTFVAALSHAAYCCPLVEQAVLADFINDGHFSRHIRRMRKLYQEKQEALVRSAQKELRGVLEIKQARAGMHLIGWLPEKMNDQVVSRRAARAGVDVRPLSFYSIETTQRPGLLMGYTGISLAEIRGGVRKLASALDRCD